MSVLDEWFVYMRILLEKQDSPSTNDFNIRMKIITKPTKPRDRGKSHCYARVVNN